MNIYEALSGIKTGGIHIDGYYDTTDALASWQDKERRLETNCMGDIRGGDRVTTFKERCYSEFKRITETNSDGITGMVIHGGNIMSILIQFALPWQDFYNYHVSNCGYFLCRYENNALTIERKGGIA